MANMQDSRDTLSRMLSTGLALGSGITGAALNFTGAALNLAQSAVRRAGTSQSTFQQVRNRIFSTVGPVFKVLCTATCGILIEPPPDTQRTEKQGERGIWVAMSCYLLHATPLPPLTFPLPTPRICRTPCGHVIRISWQRETLPLPHTPPPNRIIVKFWQPLPKSRTASI
jgi:hypothetical protein